MAWPTTSRHERGYGSAWDKLRVVILRRDKRLCQPCRRAGRLTAATAVDHVIRKADGGTDDPSNLEAICDACHADKTTRENGHTPKVSIGADGWPAT